MIVSHKLMLKAGMIRKLAAGLYTWSPLGCARAAQGRGHRPRGMNAAGAIEMAMPSIQPEGAVGETGRWAKFGPQLLKIRDRRNRTTVSPRPPRKR